MRRWIVLLLVSLPILAHWFSELYLARKDVARKDDRTIPSPPPEDDRPGDPISPA